jgi:DMSO/TMAO reductase YedYZ heme-binding membrane subunit
VSPSPLWYLTRGTGVVALLLLTAGLVLGILSTDRGGGPRRPRFVVAGLHRYVTLLALAFVGVHVVTTLADSYAPIRVVDVFIPFVSRYRPVWLGLGALGLDLLVALIVTSLVRARLGLRTWRAVHWLAYVSWPVALVHALGTGSDARSTWLVLVAVASMVAVALAVLKRVSVARRPLRIRLASGLGALAVPVLVGAWYAGGPLQHGWAKRAGTPATLLGGSRVTAQVASVPSSFAARLSGSLSEQRAGNGLLIVRIATSVNGGVEGVLNVRLEGQPAGTGVQMLASDVSFTPSTGSAYTGRIVALEGTRLTASVADASGHSLLLAMALQISPSHQVAGVVRGSASA